MRYSRFSLFQTLMKNYCLSQTKLRAILFLFAACSLHFNSFYLLSQTKNSGPLEFEIMRVDCIYNGYPQRLFREK